TARADRLQMQDDIVGRLPRELGLRLVEVEAARLKRTPAANTDAEDLAMHGELAEKWIRRNGSKHGLSTLRTGACSRPEQYGRSESIVSQILHARPDGRQRRPPERPRKGRGLGVESACAGS